jgi:hypothetical protein
MKRSLLIILCLMVSLCAFSDIASALSMYRDKEAEIAAGFGIQGWFSSADAKWQTSFPVVTSTGQPAGKIESRLDFQKIGSPVTIITAGGKIDLFSFDLLYGFGSISGGHGIDTDRFLSSSGGGLDFSQSVSSIDGDVRMLGINLFYNNKHFGETNKGPWGMVLGFLRYKDNLTMKNCIQNVSVPFNGSAFPPLGPFPPNQLLNSTFEFTWNALKVCVTHHDALTKRLSYTGMLAIYPYASYEGKDSGTYAQETTRTTSADSRRILSRNPHGDMATKQCWDSCIMLRRTLSSRQDIDTFICIQKRTDTVYFADGSAADSTLDWATVTRHGAYAELMFRF